MKVGQAAEIKRETGKVGEPSKLWMDISQLPLSRRLRRHDGDAFHCRMAQHDLHEFQARVAGDADNCDTKSHAISSSIRRR